MPINIGKGKAEDHGFILEGNIHVTPRELEALGVIAEGNDNENGAKKLGINYTTFRNHTYNVMKKLGAKNRIHALVKAVENGMIVISPKRDIIKKSEEDYLVCKFFARAFEWDETIEVQEEPFTVNHVTYEPPEWYKCPYDDCNGRAFDSYTWTSVRKGHPEYPEVPEKGVEYSISELLEEEYQDYLDAMREMRETRENE